MAATELEVANLALAALGARQITSLSGTEQEAKACDQQFDRVRDSLLRSHPWNFATKRVELEAATDPDTEWDSAWDLPSDLVRVLRIVGIGEDPANPVNDFAIEGRTLLLNGTEAPTLVYVCNSAAVTAWDSLFVDAMVYSLAAAIANRVTQNQALADSMLQKLETLALPKAGNIDAKETSSRENAGSLARIRRSSLVRARFRADGKPPVY